MISDEMSSPVFFVNLQVEILNISNRDSTGVRKRRKCLAIRKISCNFATLLGAICRHGIVNSLRVSGVGGDWIYVKK